MFKKLIYLLVFVLVMPLLSKANNIIGSEIVVEGLTYTYNLDPSLYPPSAKHGTWSVKGGTILSANDDPANGTIYVTVQWDYWTRNQEDRNGLVSYTIGSTAYIQNVTILDASNFFEVCSMISPVDQEVEYLATPQPIAFANCGLPSGFTYTIAYQWQSVELPNAFYYASDHNTILASTGLWNWQDIAGATSTSVQPPAMTYMGTTMYRCRVTVTPPSGSNRDVFVGYRYAAVRLSEFGAGTIDYNPNETYPSPVQHQVDAVQVPYNHTPLQIQQHPAIGGLCTSKVYTWEVCYNHENWIFLASGIDLPLSAHPPITTDTRIRRKVECGSDVLYSNILSYNIIYQSPWEENRNYLRVNNVLKPGIKSWPEADQLAIGDKLQSTTYFDGLARTVQQVSKETSYDESSNTWNDFVTHVQYDEGGRADKTFLPYPSSTTIGFFKTDVLTEQQTYLRGYYSEASNAPTWSKVEFENSPLSRPLQAKSSGTAWGGDGSYTGKQANYIFNTVDEDIRIWNINPAPGSIPYSPDKYPSAKLAKSVLLDEQLKKVVEYKDIEGKIVLKKVQLENTGSNLDENGYTGWLCTYYVYDDFGRLRYTITPKAVNFLLAHNWNLAGYPSVTDDLCFYYDFDEHGRAIVKHSPAAGEIYLVYDTRNRLVLSQDAKQRARVIPQWDFNLYDEFDRTIATGLFDKMASRQDMQAFVNGLTNQNVNISIFTGSSENITVNNPVAGNAGYCNSCSNTVYNTVTYYDQPSFAGSLAYYSGYSFQGGTALYPEISTRTFRVNGAATGAKVRVIDGVHDDGNYANDHFLTSNSFYDEEGRLYENLSQNIKGGVDVDVQQFDFAGRAIRGYSKHGLPGNAMDGFETFIYADVDKLGRTKAIYQKYGTNGFKKINAISYDPFGRMKQKLLSPDYNGGLGMETLRYGYNIHGWLTGINKDYALSTTNSDQWNSYFGIYLGYDNRDNAFTGKQLNGTITGMTWKSQGDNTMRRFDMEYDNAGRFTAAHYQQRDRPSDNWSTATANFSMDNISYDENGNLKTLDRMGIKPGTVGGLYVDKLVYAYKQFYGVELSNQLTSVTDANNALGTQNGLLGDFKDGTNGTADDYHYDENGNLDMDQNRKVIAASGSQGITWNYMDKPQAIHIDGKSDVEFIYDATGTKLGKKTTTIASGTIKTSWYMGNYVYTETGGNLELEYIQQEEGRIRSIDPQNTFGTQVPALELGGGITLPNGKQGVFDWMVKDHQGNTRVVLTEEVHREYHLATMEDAVTTVKDYEERTFGTVDANGNPDANNAVNNTRLTKPVQWASNTSSKVCALKGLRGTANQRSIGPGQLLKVMSGDELSTSVNYFFASNVNESGAPISGLLNQLLGSMIGSFGNGTVLPSLHENTTAISSNLGTTGGGLYTFLSPQNQQTCASGNETGTCLDVPKAYLNWLFFDENFNFIPPSSTGEGSGYTRVSQSGDGAPPLTGLNIRVPKNGYAYVYVSNESPSLTVYFDNLAITHERGRIMEENSYYPDGLKMAGACAKAYNKLPNKYGYQGDYSEEEEETGYNEFDLRMYDPQIGRWISTDPYDEFASPYLGMGNDPVNNVDPDGGSAFSLIFSKAVSIADNPSGSPLLDGLGLLGLNLGVSLGANWMHSLFPMANNVNAATLAGLGGPHTKTRKGKVGDKVATEFSWKLYWKYGKDYETILGAKHIGKRQAYYFASQLNVSAVNPDGDNTTSVDIQGSRLYDHVLQEIFRLYGLEEKDLSLDDLSNIAYVKFANDGDNSEYFEIEEENYIKIGIGIPIPIPTSIPIPFIPQGIVSPTIINVSVEVNTLATDIIARNNTLLQTKAQAKKEVAEQAIRSPYRIGLRKRYNSKKSAYEAAKRVGKGEPVLHYGKKPHYHPGNGKGKPLNHDHYYFPK